MAWTTYQLFVALVMVITGTINTLSTKWADTSSARGSNGNYHLFSHPFFQAAGMFLGELSCLFVHLVIRWAKAREVRKEEASKYNPLIFLPAALCDMCGTSLMYIGLTLTGASSFQMLRGAVIIFTALMSVAFLGRTITKHMWGGMFVVTLGLVLVGLADILFMKSKSNSDTNSVIAGDLLIIMAQIVVAVQMVYEERFITKHHVPPLAVVGWEGTFGFIILSLLLIPFYYINAKHFSKLPKNRLEDAVDAFEQIKNSWQIALATLGNIISIAFFNFAGVSVTKEINATTRMVLDSMRTILIWIVSLGVQWETFHWLQLIGFFLLIVGTCLYYKIVPPVEHCTCRKRNPEREHIINSEDDGEVQA